MSFLFAAIGAAGLDPYAEIGKYLDDGDQVIKTGMKTVDENGMAIKYGPTLEFTKQTFPDRVELQLHGPPVMANVACRTWATLSVITFTKDGTFASGKYMGAKFTRKITTTEA